MILHLAKAKNLLQAVDAVNAEVKTRRRAEAAADKEPSFDFEIVKVAKIKNGFLAFNDRAEYAVWAEEQNYNVKSGSYDYTHKAEAGAPAAT